MNRTLSMAATFALAALISATPMLASAQMVEPDVTPVVAEPPPFCKIDLPKKATDEKAQADPAKPAGDPAAQAEPTPAPKLTLYPEVSFTCADGKVKLKISGRFYGWQIGDVIPLNFKFTVPEGVKMNTDSILQGKIALAEGFKQPFELAGKPIVKTVKKDGTTEYDVTVEVRQFTIEPRLSFSMQLPYSVANAPDGTPKWEIFTTPVYALLNSIDGGYEGLNRPMTMGNTEGAKPRTPWAVPALTIVIALLLLSWPAMLILRRVNRVRPRQNISRDAAAWLAMHEVVKSGKKIGFGSTHYNRMDEVLRKYMGAVYPGLEGMTMTEVEALPDDAQGKLVKSVFRKLEAVLVYQRQLSAAEQTQLLREVDKLIARPYSM